MFVAPNVFGETAMKQIIKILLVDVDENLRGAFANLFDLLCAERKYDLIQARSVQKALDIIYQNNFDLIISDLQLLDRSGISLLIQAKDKFPNIPIIVLSAYTDLVTKEDLKLLGATYFFCKPPDLSTLKQAIVKLLVLSKKK